jgi:tRNA G10  N-methylase Trm11
MGMDIDGGDIDAYAGFLPRWLKDHRMKHTASFEPVRRDGRTVAKRFEASFASTKDDFKDGIRQHVVAVAADATEAPAFFRRRSADLLVFDAPYGIEHGGHLAHGGYASPIETLAAVAPVWPQLVRRGGALAMAWNTKSAPRDAAEKVLADAGFDIRTMPEGVTFEHRVDRQIVRDVIVATVA